MTSDTRAKASTAPLGVFYFTVDPTNEEQPGNSQYFGCDILQVRELVLAPKSAMTRMPLTELPIAGFVTIRGNSMPLLDLRAALGMGELPEAETLTCLVVDHGQKQIALRIAEPGSICNMTWGDVKPLDFDMLNRTGAFHGIVDDTENQHVISLMNIAAFLDRLDVERTELLAA